MAKQQRQVDARHYDVIVAPHITEKSTLASEFNAIVFKVAGDATKSQIKEAVEAIYDRKVANDATKPQIKEAIEALFDRKVKSVNTIVSKGKSKRWKGAPYKRSDVKKAIVTLAEGQEPIDVTSGI
jgi:large subunit ribosomal protein L23